MPGWGLNPSRRRDLSRGRDNAGSLTCCATAGTPFFLCFSHFIAGHRPPSSVTPCRWPHARRCMFKQTNKNTRRQLPPPSQGPPHPFFHFSLILAGARGLRIDFPLDSNWKRKGPPPATSPPDRLLGDHKGSVCDSPVVGGQALPFTFCSPLRLWSLFLSPVVSVALSGCLLIEFLRWDGGVFPRDSL